MNRPATSASTADAMTFLMIFDKDIDGSIEEIVILVIKVVVSVGSATGFWAYQVCIIRVYFVQHVPALNNDFGILVACGGVQEVFR